MLRALVACGWFGIQTWIGGEAIYKICSVSFISSRARPAELARHHAGQFFCFMFFWGINMFVIYRGIDTIRFLLNIKAPLLIALGLLLLAGPMRGGRFRADPVAASRSTRASRRPVNSGATSSRR